MIAKPSNIASFVCLLALSSATALAAPMGKFVDLKPVPGLDRPFSDAGISVTPDGLTAYFGSPEARIPSGEVLTPSSLFVAMRGNASEPFGAPAKLGPHINLDGGLNESPHITADGLRLYWSSPPAITDPPTVTQIFMASRNSTAEEFSTRMAIAELDVADEWEYSPSLTGDELTIVFDKGSFDPAFNIEFRDLYIASRNSISEPFSPPQAIDALNTIVAEAHPSLSSDGLTLFYTRFVGVPNNSPEIWAATRNSTSEPFDNPMSLNRQFPGSEVNSPDSATWEPFISADWPAPGSKLYMMRTTRADTRDWDFYEATWVPEPTASILTVIGAMALIVAHRRQKVC